MKSLLQNKNVITISRVLFAAVFLFSAILKIYDPVSFLKTVNNYNLLPLTYVNLFVIIIPWIEFVSGLLLLFNFYPKENSVILLSLLFIFTVAVLTAISRGIDINCGCFGSVFLQGTNWLKIFENVILFLIGYHTFYNAPVYAKNKTKNNR